MSSRQTSGHSTAKLLTVKEVSELLHLGQRTIYRLSDAGELPRPIRISRLVRWRLADIEEFIQQCKQ